MSARWMLGVVWALAAVAMAGEGGGTVPPPNPNPPPNQDGGAGVETLFTKPVAKTPGGPRLDIPDAANQKAAVAEMQERFKIQLARRKPARRRELIDQFLERARETARDANPLWVELDQALNLALELKDYQTVLAICDCQAERFNGLEALAQKRAVFGKVKADAVITAILKLLETPTDPNANTVVGKHFCFAQGNWEVGLPLLACGGTAEPELRQVAEIDLTKPIGSMAQSALGDLWYDQGKKTKPPYREQMFARCCFWYGQATSGLTGTAKDRVSKRMVEIRDELPLPPTIDWDNLLARQWDQLEGQVFIIPVAKKKFDTGMRLMPKQKVRVVPHPTDTWTVICYKDHYTTDWKGTQQKGYQTPTGYDDGDHEFRLGELVVYYETTYNKQTAHAGVFTFYPVYTVVAGAQNQPPPPSEAELKASCSLFLGPNLNRGDGSKGSIRVKILPYNEDE